MISFNQYMNIPRWKNKFGQKVREKRKEEGLSQEKLSFEADLNRTYIGMIERGERNPTLRSMIKIADALEVNIKELL